jgi:osmotically-inducible protein OsmY
MTVATAAPRLPVSISDERLAHAISSAIRATRVRPMAGLTIAVTSDVVTLRGRARSFYEKQLLVHAVRHVPGVCQVVDEVDVLPLPPR